jgi:aldehyde oxidoreductase
MIPPDIVTVRLRINGETVRVDVPPRRRLVDLLRSDLGHTATKEGCGCGECGACTVLLDGRPVNSCVVPAVEADGREVVTAEGLGADRLHLVQRAFVATGAVQCGYCTPGMVLAAAALLERYPDPDEGTIREALAGNVCRCSGYAQIVAAVRMAASGDIPAPEPHRVGSRAPREDAEAKVTGRTRYTDDLPRPDGLLHAVVVRATEAHALVTAVETEDARAVPGVVAVLTHRDVPGEALFGNAIHDQPVLAADRVRFLGEAVAVVVAETREAAKEGRDRVQIAYDRLPAVTDAAAALRRGSEQVHPDRDDRNLMGQLQLERGDVDAAMGDAHQVVERTYRTSWQEHACLEPEVAQAEHDGEGGIVVRCPSQNVFFDRLHVHKALDLERAQVRVIQQPTGAAFGGREDIYAQTHAALAALHTGRPVRLLWSREESQIATTKRHPMTMVYRAGLDAEGRIVALDVDALADTGAYASWGPNIARKTLVHAAGPFAVDNQRVRVRMAYTNNGISGAFRGFGATQVTYGYGVFAGELARECGVDHLEFLRRNHLQPGQITATGQEVRGDGLARCLERALESAGDPPSSTPGATIRRGRGLCTFLYGIGYGNAIPDIGSAVVELADDGHIQVRCGAVDYGQGARTVFLQVVCDVLGIEASLVEIITGDTHLTPDSGSTVASRQTTVSGSAVAKAARTFGEAMVKAAARLLERDASDLTTGPEGIVDADEGDVWLTWAELARGLAAAGIRRAKQARYRLKSTRLDLETGQGDAYGTYAFGCQIADVSVDTTTGAVTVDRIHAAHDVGRAINPAMVEGQIVGGTVMGLGFALTEHHRIDGGVPVTWNFDTYRLPAATDAPDVVPLIVEEPDDAGPYGARGIGEPAMVATAPAIANAVADAVGATVRELPMTPERVWRAMNGEGA